MITFSIADVERGSKRLETCDVRDALPKLLKRRSLEFEAVSSCAPLAVGTWWNPFIAAADAAFAFHLPLVLSPDAVWLCIVQGFAAHVTAHPEELRPRLVRHPGKLLLDIRADEFSKGACDNPWPQAFGRFSDAVAEHTGKLRDLLTGRFSTTTETTQAAFDVALMDACADFFEYQMSGLCGIPEVTLEGTADDWRLLRQRAHALHEYDAAWWVDALLPVLDRLVESADGRPDREFWHSLYNCWGESGGPYMTGWINVLFPYLWSGRGEPHRFDCRNWLAAHWAEVEPSEDPYESPSGAVKQKICPMGVSRVDFTWRIEAPPAAYEMQLFAGFFGIAQDPVTLAVRPEIGWAISAR